MCRAKKWVSVVTRDYKWVHSDKGLQVGVYMCVVTRGYKWVCTCV